MDPISCMKGSCLEFLVAPLFQRAKGSPQPLANPPNMPAKGPVCSFNYAWYTNRETEMQMVKSEAEEEISLEPLGTSDPGQCFPGLHNLHLTTFFK